MKRPFVAALFLISLYAPLLQPGTAETTPTVSPERDRLDPAYVGWVQAAGVHTPAIPAALAPRVNPAGAPGARLDDPRAPRRPGFELGSGRPGLPLDGPEPAAIRHGHLGAHVERSPLGSWTTTTPPPVRA